MRIHNHVIVGLASAAIASANDTPSLDPASYASGDVIHRDVAIVGGGAAGTYAAINLKDKGTSVVVIERKGTLGGQVNTYTDPTTGTAIDYGVIAYWNTSIVTKFFERLNTPIMKLGGGNGAGPTTVYADFRTGQSLSPPPTGSLAPYIAQMEKYPGLLEGWDIPYPVPADLLLPFGDFIVKYGLQDAAYEIYNLPSSGGLINILNQTTAVVFKAFNDAVVQESKGAVVTTAAHGNHLLYANAQAALGPDDVLFKSTVVAASRPTATGENEPSVTLAVRTPRGDRLLIVSQLLVSMPPVKRNMAPFDLDPTETALIDRFQHNAYYCGLVNNTGLPVAHNYINAENGTLYNIPEFPAMYHLQPTAVNGILSFWYGAPRHQPAATVKSEVLNAVARLGGSGKAEIVAFADHSPYNLHVPAAEIQAGFWANFTALQGQRHTWYTGATLVSGSGPIWVYTDSLLPNITAAVAAQKQRRLI